MSQRVALKGANAGDESGASVSVAGDINGDGIDDLIIGAPYATTVAAYAGKSYLVFGSNKGFPNPLNLTWSGSTRQKPPVITCAVFWGSLRNSLAGERQWA